MKYKKEFIVLSLLIFLFLFLELYQIDLPGLFGEEGFNVLNAVKIIKISERQSLLRLFFQRRLPLMTCQYHGSLESYISLPFFYLLGINVITLRLIPIIFSIFTILFTYLFVKNFLNRKIAFITIVLLIINPTFIMGIKTGMWHGSIMQAFSISSLFCLLKWYRHKNDFYFYTAILLLGLGLSIRIWFAWFIVAIFIAALIFIRTIKNNFLVNRTNILKYIFIGGLTFCLGAVLIVFYNFTSRFAMIKFLAAHFKRSSNSGINNLDYLRNFPYVVKNFHNLLTGQLLFGEQFNKWEFFNNLYPWVFWACIAFLVLSILLKKIWLTRKKILFLLILFFAIFFQAPITPSFFPYSHFFFLYPLPQVILAITIFYLIESFQKRKIMLVIIITFFAIFSIKELSLLQKYFYFLHKEGGVNVFSDTIYELADYLKEKRLKTLICDWGLYYGLYILTEGKIDIETFAYVENVTRLEPEQTVLKKEFIEDLKGKFRSNNRLSLIFHAPEFTRRECYNIVTEIAKGESKDITEERKFYQRDGRLIYLVYSLR